MFTGPPHRWKKRQRKKIAKLWEKNNVRVLEGLWRDSDTGHWSIKARGIRETRQTRQYGRDRREMIRRVWFSAPICNSASFRCQMVPA